MKLKGFCRKYPLATLVCSLVLVVACASFLPEDGLWSQIAKSFVLSLVALACAWPFLPGLCEKGSGKASGSSFGKDNRGASIAQQAEGSVEAPIAGDLVGADSAVFATRLVRLMRLASTAHTVHPGGAGDATVAAGAPDSENLRDAEGSACAESAESLAGVTYAGDVMGLEGVERARDAMGAESARCATGLERAESAEGPVGAAYAGNATGSGGAESARCAAGTESSKRADSLGILLYAAFLLAAALVGGVASAISTASGFHLDALPHDLGFWVWRGMQVALLCLTTAVFEEALFRGVVFSCLVERFRVCGLPIPVCFTKRVSQNSARKGSMGEGDTRKGDVREGDTREGNAGKGNARKGDVREGNAREIRTGDDCGSGCEKEGDLSRKQECSGYGLESPESPESPRLPETPEAMELPETPGLSKPSEMIGLSKSLCLPKTSEMTGLPGLLGLLKLPKPPSLPKTPKTPKTLGSPGAPGLPPLPKTLGLSDASGLPSLPRTLGMPGLLGLAEVAAAALSAILFGLLHVSASDMGMIARSLESLASMGFSGDSATFSQLQLSLVLSAQMIFKIAQASLFGFCMAALFVKTHSLLSPVVVHAVFDVFYLGPQVFLTGALPNTYITGNCVDLAILGLTIALLLPPSFKSARWLAYEVVPYSSFNRQKRWFDKGSA